MKKLKWLSFLCGITALIVVIHVGSLWVSKKVLTGANRFPSKFLVYIDYVSEIPNTFKGIVGELLKKNHKIHSIGTGSWNKEYNGNGDLPRIEELSKNNIPGSLLIARSDVGYIEKVELIIIKTGKIIPVANITLDQLKSGKRTYYHESKSMLKQVFQSDFRVLNPLIHKNGQLFFVVPYYGIVSYNFIQREVNWILEGSFHHSLEVDDQGFVWACASVESKPRKGFKHDLKYEDNSVVKIDSNGAVISSARISEMLEDNGYEFLVYGVSNPILNKDPFHLNQVTPVTAGHAKIQPGRLAISLRNISTVLIYSPSDRSVEWVRTGPWMNQHCIQIVYPDSISVLDNHSFASLVNMGFVGDRWRSSLTQLNLVNDKICVLDIPSEGNKIQAEGRGYIIDGKYAIIENSARGEILIYIDSEVVFRYRNYVSNGSVGVLSWLRYLNQSETERVVSLLDTKM